MSGQSDADTVREAQRSRAWKWIDPDKNWHQDAAGTADAKELAQDVIDLLAALARLEAERDAYKDDRDSYDDVFGRRMAERDEWHKRAEEAEAEVVRLREVLEHYANGTFDYDKARRALLASGEQGGRHER
jgi:chromosome segregation ATPase